MREEPAHHFFRLLYGKVLSGLTVYLVGELRAVIDHLLHSHILRELAVLIAVDAVIFIGCAIGIRAADFIRERHSATLTELLFHNNFLCFIRQLGPFQNIVGLDYAAPITKLEIIIRF